MALPYRGDEDFGARRGSYTPAEDVEPVKRTGLGQAPRSRMESFQPSEASNQGKCIKGVKNFQNVASQKCCSCIGDRPLWCFLLTICLLFLLLIAALLLAVWFFAIKTPSPEAAAAYKEQELKQLRSWMIPGLFNMSRVSHKRSAPQRRFQTIDHELSPNISLCQGYGFACTSEPEKVVNFYQRCDGVADCTDGSDEDFCTSCQTAFKCPKRRSTGGSGVLYNCLRGKQVCDGTYNCFDNSDEAICGGKASCNDTEFQCGKSGNCIPQELRCDGDKHCKGNEDEKNCDGKCQSGAVWCNAERVCIPKWKRCDGVRDCSGGEDEKDCSCKECCGRDRVLCLNSKICIKRAFLCDGRRDCPDGSDEANCGNSCSLNSVDKTDIVICADGRSYRKDLACSGFIEKCKNSCPKCDERYAITCDKHKCVPKILVCDGKTDCADGSDEKDCSKHAPSDYPCRIYRHPDKWIKQEQRCDGVEDCLDGSDERNCTTCRNNAILCWHTRTCIPFYKRCDGVIDCLGGADEEGCTCKDCAFRQVPLYKCSAANRCIRYINGCGPAACPNETKTDKLFCLRHQSLRQL